MRDDLSHSAVLAHPHLSVAGLQPYAFGGEGAAEHHLARVLCDVDEASGADRQVELASHRMNPAGYQADAEAVLKELDLLPRADDIAADLGYGEQRRLDLGLALVGRPTVLLLDEPMAGLSVKESLDLAHHLKALTSRWNVSVLLVEHDMDLVFGISDVVTVFQLGRVIASGAPAAGRRL